MHKYILEKQNFYIANAAFNKDGVLELQMTSKPEEALALHFKKTIVQLRKLIYKTIKVKFKIIKVW